MVVFENMVEVPLAEKIPPKLIEADLTQVSKLHSLFEPAPSETDNEQVEKAGG